jgi:hypothetical protein
VKCRDVPVMGINLQGAPTKQRDTEATSGRLFLTAQQTRGRSLHKNLNKTLRKTTKKKEKKNRGSRRTARAPEVTRRLYGLKQ